MYAYEQCFSKRQCGKARLLPEKFCWTGLLALYFSGDYLRVISSQTKQKQQARPPHRRLLCGGAACRNSQTLFQLCRASGKSHSQRS